MLENYISHLSERILWLQSQSDIVRYIAAILIAAIFIIISKIVEKIINRYAKQYVKSSKTKIDDILFENLLKPVKFGIYILGTVICLNFLGIPLQSIQILFKPLYALLILFSTHIIVKIVRTFLYEINFPDEKEKYHKPYIDARLLPVVQNIVSFVLYTIGIVIALSALGVEISPIIASMGIAGAAVALASQDTLSNIIAGFFFVIDRPYLVGDIIQIDQDEFGEVLSIGLRTTRIRTFSNNIITLPNAQLAKKELINYSAEDSRVKIKIQIGVAYGTDVNKVKKILSEIAWESDDVLRDPPPQIFFIEFGSFSYNFIMFVWTHSYMKKYKIIDFINTRIKERFDEEGIIIPFPTNTVYLEGKT